MRGLIKNIVRFILFVFFQVFVLDKVLLHQMLTPYLYLLFILWLPFKINRTVLMLVGFFLGYTIDSFRHQPGFHAAACLLIAYTRPFVINLLISQQGAESNYDEPSIKSMGGMSPYLIYIGILILLHNSWLILLESWQFADAGYFFLKTILSSVLCFLLIVVTEMIFSRNQKFKTNTV